MDYKASPCLGVLAQTYRHHGGESLEVAHLPGRIAEEKAKVNEKVPWPTPSPRMSLRLSTKVPSTLDFHGME